MNYVSDTIFSKLAMLSGIILYNAANVLKQGIQMLTPEQVKSLIEGVAACEHVEVEGDGHHFFAVIVSSEFEGKAPPRPPPPDQRRSEGAIGQQRITRAVDFRCRHTCGMGGEAAISRTADKRRSSETGIRFSDDLFALPYPLPAARSVGSTHE